MDDAKLLQLIRDKILNVTTNTSSDLDNAVYLQQIRGAILGVTQDNSKYGNLDEAIYLQQIRDAILGVTIDNSKYGSLDNAIYLQQIRDAYNGIAARVGGGMDDDIYLAEILGVATPPGGGDTTAPTVTAVEVQTGLTVDVTFSEAMGTGVTTASNYTVSGTGKGSLANNPNSVALVSGNKYRCTWTSGEMFNGGNITIAVANAQDAAGNAVNSNGTHTGGAIGTAPTVAITSASSGVIATTFTCTFTFSEDVTGFAVGDITVVNGSAGTFNAVSASVYTAVITPTTIGAVTVDVNAGVCTDGAGNNNTAATQFSIYYGVDTFDRTDGDLANGWTYTAGKWTIATNAAVGTPGLGSTLNANPGFDADTDWTKETADWSIGSGVASHAAGAGQVELYQGGILTTGQWYRVDWTITAISASNFFIKYLSILKTRSTAATFVDTERATFTTASITAQAATVGSVDNATWKQITLADMFCTRNFGLVNIDISIPLVNIAGTQNGIVIGLDSAATPANFLLAYHNGTNAVLVRCLAGSYTQLISSAATYADGRILRLTKNGTTVKLYYNNSQIGTDQTLTSPTHDAIINATRHGMFSTYGSNSLGSFTATNPT